MNFYIQCAITAVLFFLPIKLVTSHRIPPIVFWPYFGVLLLVAVILPLLFHNSLWLQRGVLYFYFLDRPEEGSLKHPEVFGLNNTRNFYIKNGNITLGAWHLLPASFEDEDRTSEEYESLLASGAPIILYIHGNLGSRATEHRLHLYQVLQKLNYHVITFDYRCFGDSTYGTPHERAVVSDCLTVARWVFDKAGSSPVYLYGHSLGAGMTTHMAAQLARDGFESKGVILEAPFDNMPSEIRVHPFGRVFRIFPWYNYLFSNPYYTNGEDFYSSKYILEFTAPIMILHAEDDGIIPCRLGIELFRIGQEQRSKESGPMSLTVFEYEKGYGHADLCKAPEVPSLLRNFVEKYKYEAFKNSRNQSQ